MQTLLSLVGVYALVGLVFAIWFVSTGHRRLDPAAMSLGARLIILPASAALWPVLAIRTLRGRHASPPGGDLS